MGRKAKTPKFEEFNKFENCFGEKKSDSDSWREYLDDRPIVLEVGSGKASFLLELAKSDETKNYIGCDLKSDRLHSAAKAALSLKIDNIAFIQANAENLPEYFDKGSVREIWVTFPDPYPKDRHAKRRLTGKKFLDVYHDLLIENGSLHFKTDDINLFNWSKSEIKESKKFDIQFYTNDLHSEQKLEIAKIMTNYEKKFISEGIKINYLSAKSLGV